MLLLPTGLAGTAGTAARIAAGPSRSMYAWAVAVVCLPVGVPCGGPSRPRLDRSWRPSAWFPLIAVVDVVVVVTGSWRWVDPVDVAALAGVLAQAILATLVYLAPLLRGRSTRAR